MPINRRKQKQLERFVSDTKRFKRLTRKKENLSDNLCSQGNFITRILFNGKRRVIKFGEGEDLQNKNIKTLLHNHFNFAKSKEISPIRYKLKANPYIYSSKKVGVMKDLGVLSLKKLSKILSFIKLNGKEKVIRTYKNKPQFKPYVDFLEKYNPSSEKTLETYLSLQKNLDKCIGYTDNSIGDNLYVTGFDKKTHTYTIAVIDQITPSTLEMITKKRSKNDR